MSKRHVVLIAAALSLIYFVIQLVYIQHLPLVMDEFDGANEAYQLLHLTPYRDYRPYKTVLGYYLQLPPLLFTNDPWSGLILSKIWLAIINTAAILAATLSLARIFSPAAALTGQVLLISVTTFLERSSEIRVDMLTAWVGLASFLLLLQRRWLVAGIVAGFSFLVSQKGVYYLLAANTASGIFWLVESRDRKTFRDWVLLNAAAVSLIALYVAAWGSVSTPGTVFSATFLSHGSIAFGNLYDNLEQYWTRTLTRNPLFYWGALAGVVALAVARWRGRVGATHLVTAVYGAAIIALCRWHKQPWPYFFVILIPTLMVVHVAFADMIWRDAKWRTRAGIAAVLLGVAWPLTYMPGIIARSQSYQRHVVQLAAAILGDNDTYLAGNDLVYNGHQASEQLRRLSAPTIVEIREWPQERIDDLIREIEQGKPKLIIRDYRIIALPASLRTYFVSRFDNLWSSVWIYAPVLGTDDHEFEIWFDGTYVVQPPSGTAIIDGHHVAPGQTLVLTKGRHDNSSAAPIRLKLQPPGLADHLDPAMKGRRPMFARAYDY